jgi:DNA repair photolyase
VSRRRPSGPPSGLPDYRPDTPPDDLDLPPPAHDESADLVQLRRGRGALSNRSGRYEPTARAAFDDGWGTIEEPLPPLETIVTDEVTRTLISRNDSPDIPFDRSINPYKGCEHGCIYCFARPTHAYLGLSPGIDFETRITAKPDAAAALRAELSRPSYRPEVIALGANTDPYQPIERRRGITRQILEVLRDFRHPVGIVTKSALVVRDLDILTEMARQNLARVYLSVTSLDRTLARRMEPRASAPERRLDAMRQLADAGVPVGVLASPMIPALNDAELERILEAAVAAGASSANYILVRLPLEIKELFEEWLRGNYPDRADRVLDLIRTTRGGKLYDSTWGVRMRGEGPYAALLERRFEVAARRLGLDRRRPPLATDLFRVPAAPTAQLSLFDRE